MKASPTLNEVQWEFSIIYGTLGWEVFWGNLWFCFSEFFCKFWDGRHKFKFSSDIIYGRSHATYLSFLYESRVKLSAIKFQNYRKIFQNENSSFRNFFMSTRKNPSQKNGRWWILIFSFIWIFLSFIFGNFHIFFSGGGKRKKIQIGICFLGGKFRIELKGKFEEKLLRWILLLVWTYENVK